MRIRQKQPFADLLQNMYSSEFRNNLRKTELESLFSKVEGLKDCNFLKKRLQHRFFPLNIAKFFRTAFFIEQLWWFLRKKEYWVIFLE